MNLRPRRNRNPPPPELTSQETTEHACDELDRKLFFKCRHLSHNEIDWTLSKNILSKTTQNTILSPFLVELMLSILAEASSGNTHSEIETVLPHIKDKPRQRVLFELAFGRMLEENSHHKLSFGSKIYVDQSIRIHEGLRGAIKTYFNSDIEPVDFNKPEEISGVINGWCANVTDDHLTNIVSREDTSHNQSAILMLNAMYLESTWRHPFPENQTTIRDFSINQNEVVTCPFITQIADYWCTESRKLNSIILRLPYQGDKFAMYIALPQKVDGLEQLLQKVNRSTWARALKSMAKAKVKVALPKIKFSNSISLKDTMNIMGIRQIFTNETNLTELVYAALDQDERVKLSNVLQMTGIEINEKGSTASTATDTSMTDNSDCDYEFIANRPFLFLVEDESAGTWTFIGKVLHPKY